MWKELPKPLMSDFGFQGCIASIELNGEMIDPMKVGKIRYYVISRIVFSIKLTFLVIRFFR